MGRVYLRKTNRGSDGGRYSRVELETAVADVLEGRKTMRGAAKYYHIPRSTLKHYVRGTRGTGVVAASGSGGGGRTSLSSEEEHRLVQGILTMEKWGFGLSRHEVLDIVQMYTKANNLKTKFKDGRPGEEWYLSFARRHKLSIKKPQAVEYLRMSQVNPFIIYGFFELLTSKVDELNLTEKPQQIYNLDETSFSHDPKKTKVVGAVGRRSTRMISSAGRENTSVLICTSASGHKLPPLVIFKGKNVIESWLSQNVKDEMAYAASKRGWMESTIFYNWFKKSFLPNIGKDRPVLLIYDGHSTHVSPEVCQLATDNAVTILKLPPHTTHVLQPLDVAIFGPFKTSWDKHLVKWQRLNPRKRIPKKDFVELLNKVYNDIPVVNIKSGFRNTGIYDDVRAILGGHPVNKDAIKVSIFRPEDLKRYQDRHRDKNLSCLAEIPHVTAQSGVDLQSNSGLESERIEPPTTLNANDNQVTGCNRLFSVDDKENYEPEPSTSFKIVDKDIEENSGLDTNQTTTNVEDCRQREEQQIESNTQFKSFEDLLLTMVKGTKEAPDYITRLEKERASREEKAKKKDSQKAKAVKTKRKCADSSSNKKPIDDTGKESNVDELITATVISNNSYVIVDYNGMYYPGQVISVNEDIIRIKHMEKCGKTKLWRWPEKPDCVDYNPEDIAQIIGEPVLKNKRNMYDVPEILRFSKGPSYTMPVSVRLNREIDVAGPVTPLIRGQNPYADSSSLLNTLSKSKFK
ncbi:hypothetical protein NQ315_002742 [Exocentrus adspersus]|uniref:HTH CENPB-type domain-containing protein n=1 Tax=Exocentrus adspersus TaxID=1586481 RepID=A0AAV8V6I0_9CUCU|nr:hypothetical protein NQ315_002742 [Exocentrus adspersus]